MRAAQVLAWISVPVPTFDPNKEEEGPPADGSEYAVDVRAASLAILADLLLTGTTTDQFRFLSRLVLRLLHCRRLDVDHEPVQSVSVRCLSLPRMRCRGRRVSTDSIGGRRVAMQVASPTSPSGAEDSSPRRSSIASTSSAVEVGIGEETRSIGNARRSMSRLLMSSCRCRPYCAFTCLHFRRVHLDERTDALPS